MGPTRRRVWRTFATTGSTRLRLSSFYLCHKIKLSLINLFFFSKYQKTLFFRVSYTIITDVFNVPESMSSSTDRTVSKLLETISADQQQLLEVSLL
ncbi:hypothetical protein F7725_013812 [Dissostichus mawsoni]|uniref:Uncharacterized protein n=1 Tax=Dissostichus mawsoni TaxID=36200 RepID=A0A7J5YU35_DISMA|nr:hypothetical protein F7725_013812 [Dissostichus mawsoni]